MGDNDMSTTRLNDSDIRKKILTTINDLVCDFLYYDRKEDEELSAADIEDAVDDGDITIDDMVKRFESELREGLSVDDG